MLRTASIVLLVSSCALSSTFALKLPVGAPVGVSETDGGFIVAGSRSHRCIVMKIDEDGAILWKASFLFPGGDPECIAALPDGGFAIAGTRNLVAGDEAYLIRAGSDGLFEWGRTAGVGVSSHGKGCIALPGGGIAVCGDVCNSTWPDGEGFVTLFSSDGAITDSEVYDLDSYSSVLCDVSVFPGGRLALSGSEYNTISWTMLAEPDLSTIWNSAPYVGGWSTTNACLAAPGGCIAICGNEGYHVYSWNFLRVFDAAGTEIVDEGFSTSPPSDVPALYDIDAVESGGYCVTGLALGDCVLFRADSSGNELWRVFYTQAGAGRDVLSLDDGFMILAQHNSMDSWVIRTDENGSLPTSVTEPTETGPSSSQLDVLIWPNPSVVSPSIEVGPGSGEVWISIFDSSGRLVSDFRISEAGRGCRQSIPGITGANGGLPSGVYLVRAESSQGWAEGRFVILSE